MINFEALFLGPQSENYMYFKEILDFLVNEHLFWRRNFHPEDLPSITFEDQQRKDFLETMQKVKEILLKLSSKLKTSSMPWCSPRYLGHMTSDILMPSLLAYIATLLYNPNNVAYEGAPATVSLELEVGKLLAELMGFDKEKAWGHITSGGTVANYEGLWVARNLKYLPFVLRDVAKKYNVNLMITYKGKLTRIDQLKDFELLNINPKETLNAMDNLLKLTSEQGNSIEKVTEEIRKNGLRAKGLSKINVNLGYVLAPQSRHYSWDKAMDVLGLGTENLIKVPVDSNYRMNISELRKIIEELTEKEIPILAVVGVVGSTEEGSVDEIHRIVSLRKQMEKEGISFYIHVDAAYGGYARSIFIENGSFLEFDTLVKTLDDRKIIASGLWPPKEVYEAFKAMSEVDSITVDPHKLGYTPYPAGAIVFADKRIRTLISYIAPYIFEEKEGRKIEEIFLGSFIMEGSKPGASAAAVWSAIQACPLNMEGYGRLIGESVEGAQLLYKKIDSFAFKVSNLEIIAKALTPPDLNILVYAFNIKGNTSLDVMNSLNEKIKQKLSYSGTRPILTLDFIVSRTELSYQEYGDTPVKFLERLGIPEKEWFSLEPEKRKVVVLRSCIMSPYLTKDYTEEDYASKFIEGIKLVLLQLDLDKLMKGI